jgi:tetratricopeptide (TPR) repeat protein
VTHPDAEELAFYAEHRTLEPGAAAIEEHLAVCAECRDVVADAAAYFGDAVAMDLPAPSPISTVAPFRRRKLVVTITAAVAVAAAILLAVRFNRERSESTTFTDLVAVVNREPTRALEGRLAGFRYAPAAAVNRGTAAVEATPDLRIAAATLEKAAAGKRDAASLAASGVAHAVVGELDAAIADLERAVEGDASHAQYPSDLSAVYGARGRRDSRPADYEAALTAADRALAIDPSSPNACFNRALALEALTRRDEARAAWEQCLTREKDGAWAEEIRIRRAAHP